MPPLRQDGLYQLGSVRSDGPTPPCVRVTTWYSGGGQPACAHNGWSPATLKIKTSKVFWPVDIDTRNIILRTTRGKRR